MNGISRFGEAWLAGIQNAQRVELWALTYREEETTGRLSGYRTTGQLATLDAQSVLSWQALVVDPDAVETTFVKRVPFRPELALVFGGTDTHAVLLLDTESGKWGTVLDGKPVSIDVNRPFAGAEALRALDPRNSSHGKSQ